MVKKIISDIVNEAAKAETMLGKTNILKKYNDGTNTSIVLMNVLKAAFDPAIKWALPEGVPPYKPGTGINQEDALYARAKNLYLFIDGGHPTLKQLKRETLFIEFLESIHPNDAIMILNAKDKHMPGLNYEVVQEAFPGLL